MKVWVRFILEGCVFLIIENIIEIELLEGYFIVNYILIVELIMYIKWVKEGL